MIRTEIDLFARKISGFVEVLLKDGKVGMCAGVLRISDIRSGCVSKKGPSADRFKLTIPYAGTTITWEILFNSNFPDDPPDFIFSPEDEDFCPNMEALPSLMNWDIDEPTALLRVIQEMLEQYKHHHCSLISRNSRLQFEYTSLLEHSQFSRHEIEVHVTKKNDGRLGQSNFLIKLPTDFSRIPPYITKDNPGEDTAVLLVTFPSPDGSKAMPQLFCSPSVEHALGDSALLRIPSFPPGGCLLDYVPTVCELLKNKVDQIVQSHERKRDYISALLSFMGRSMVEYDQEGFSKISFLLEWHDFFFIVTVELPLLFPSDRPPLVFQSVYHEASNGQPYSQVVKDYPYSPRWSPIEMAERVKVFITDYIKTFQRGSVTEGSI